jgi:hypothetical protein
MAVRVTGGGPVEMKKLAVELKAADPKFKRELQRNMRAIAAPVVARVRESILTMPSHHDGTLRGQVARTVSSSVGLSKSGVRLDIISSGAKMPAGEDRLPGFLDSARGFNHPVFGNRGVWRRQWGKTGWFENPITQEAPAMKAAVQAAMDETARHLEG